MDTVVPAEGNGDLQTLICVLVPRPRRCPTLSNPVPWALTKLNGCLSQLHSVDEDAVSWLTHYGYWLMTCTREERRRLPLSVENDRFLRAISEIQSAVN